MSPDNLSEPADIEELKEQTLDDHISTVDRKVDPNNGHVCQLVLGVVGSTASAPIFTKFGNPESVKNLTSGPTTIGMTHQEEIDLQESNLSETNLVETSLLESSLVETSLVESNLKETNLVDTSLVEISSQCRQRVSYRYISGNRPRSWKIRSRPLYRCRRPRSGIEGSRWGFTPLCCG